MEFKDYYKILGVSDDAEASDIKKAYRKLARKYHPDVSKEAGAEARFKEVGEAYEVLSDPEKRAEYDQIRQLGARGYQQGAAGAGTGAGQGFSEEDLSRQFTDFFESIFGGMGGGHRQAGPDWQQAFSQRGQDMHHKIALFLEEAASGVQRQIRLQVPEVDAYGRVHRRTKTLNVKIPPGVVAGQRIRLAGQGGPGVGDGATGDLFLEIELAPHPVFGVDGKDLLLTLPVTPWEAALGARVKAPTLTGQVNLTIPKGSASGQRLRLKGKGLGRNPTGDLIVTLQVTVPKRHSDEALALYQKLAQTEADFDPRKQLEARS
ncbi:DnaJ C-terminal domain-containing protein [Saccharospirillum salsuginis]|uniref:Curved DNA-binding protein n=1 Tax=Saccharospirillum salsuginis TaxID=418750 RepID=A0A918KKF1_9GAMM|nr:DnaJ C-terminal domain-containing protein [Saccharospirillum salsuginis]GGX66727.1 curved DNA-binding protein [Saccharospirillum salsuginis]